nr:hypothetical protein [Rhizobium leguminosarum]
MDGRLQPFPAALIARIPKPRGLCRDDRRNDFGPINHTTVSPKKGDTASWWAIGNGLTKTCMFARDASFGDDLRQAYGIEWAEDLFGPADEDNR